MFFSVLSDNQIHNCFIAALSQPATGPSITCQGNDVTLQCVIIPMNIVWRRNGTVVDSNVLTNHQFVFNSTYNAVTDLAITNVTLEDDNSSIVLNVIGQEIKPVYK